MAIVIRQNMQLFSLKNKSCTETDYHWADNLHMVMWRRLWYWETGSKIYFRP